ncbi:MAG: hypothetical protein GX417_09725 [Clostridiales bacterium]|nr:hypothetical protein [Clostridiales bacterium]
MKNILWTGGWDSTFRVLELAIVKKEIVQPYYILDNERESSQQEQNAMKKIKELMTEKFPHTTDAIKELIIISKSDIPPNATITRDFNRLLSKSYLGPQYEWLGRYADASGLSDLELCIHRDDKATNFLHSSVKKADDENDSYDVLDLENMTYPELSLFKYYRFPILRLTKVQMHEIAMKYGFDDIMEHTWFCHHPRNDGSPCGLCNPCKYTRSEGLGRRVPKPTVFQFAGYYCKRALKKLKDLCGRD